MASQHAVLRRAVLCCLRLIIQLLTVINFIRWLILKTNFLPEAHSLLFFLEVVLLVATNLTKCMHIIYVHIIWVLQVCQSIYKPGDDVSSCWSCSAFTTRRTCQTGDIMVYYDQGVCFTCSPQPICGKCVDPCTVTATSVDVIPQTYPVTAKSTTPSSSKISSTTLAINKGANAQTITVTFTFTYQVSTTITYAKAIAFSEKATAKVGVPLIGETGLEFSSTQTFTDTNAKTTSQTATYTIAIAQQIPAYTQQKVTATGSLGTVIADVSNPEI